MSLLSPNNDKDQQIIFLPPPCQEHQQVGEAGPRTESIHTLQAIRQAVKHNHFSVNSNYCRGECVVAGGGSWSASYCVESVSCCAAASCGRKGGGGGQVAGRCRGCVWLHARRSRRLTLAPPPLRAAMQTHTYLATRAHGFPFCHEAR